MRNFFTETHSLIVSGNGVICIGYVGDEAATKAVLDSEGWYRTGDVCYFDGKDRIHIVDRLKEMIKYKGYQVREIRD